MADAESPSAALGKILVLLTAKMWFAHAGIYSTSTGGRAFRCMAQTKPAISASVAPFNKACPEHFLQAVKTSRPVYLPDATQVRDVAGEVRLRSLYVVPLILRSRLLGVLSVHTYENNAIDKAGRALVDQFAGLAALALERVELQRDAPEESAVLESMFAQSQVGVALAGLDGAIRRVNTSLAELLGYPPASFAGRRISELVPADEREQFIQAEQQAGNGQPHPGFTLHRYAQSSGEVIWCSTRLNIIWNADGKPEFLLFFVMDGSATKQAMHERDRLKNELLQLQKIQTLGMLAGGVAHDFNNALEVIMGFASLARLRVRPGDPLHEPLKIIEGSAQGAAILAGELLEAVRIDESEAQFIEVPELMDSVVRIVSRTFDRKIELEHDVEPQMPCVRGFHGRFEQALLNLCLNARDSMPGGGRLTLKGMVENLTAKDPQLPASFPPGAYVRMVVRDTGTGMPPEVVEHICEPLFTTKSPGQNAGLGLTMVERIVQDAGGFMTISSALSKGTEIALYLPAVPSQCSRLPRKPAGSQLILGRGTVLVVDDEPRVLDFLEKGLTRLGYKVLCAQSGKQACEIYSKQPQDVVCVLLDMIMPDLSGLETYAKLRDINPQVKVILSSGYSSERVKREAVEAGGADFLGKPYTLETLSQALHKYRQI